MKKQTFSLIALMLFSCNKSGDLIDYVALNELSTPQPQNTPATTCRYLVVNEKLTIFSKMRGRYVRTIHNYDI